MGDCRILVPSELYVLHKADSGAMRFKVKSPRNARPVFRFTSKHDPYKQLYKITMGRVFQVTNIAHKEELDTTHSLSNVNFEDFVEFWVTWYNKKIKMGLPGEEMPFLVHRYCNNEVIGFIQFDTMCGNSIVDWIFEEAPAIKKQLPCPIFEEELTWARITDNRLPLNALIGGFEKEPIYIARVQYRHSLIPGKYVPSTGMAFVPWGTREHGSTECEILCGHNAKWVKSRLDYIPPDAFIAGYSEVRREPLYVGRAMHDDCLVVGKIHMLYQLCYLPYHGKEIEATSCEILTVPKKIRHVEYM